MKNLLLIRHAKSSWDEPGLEDRERPLSKRGIEDIPIMAEVLKKYNVEIDKFFCSAALRAKMTLEILANMINIDSQKIIFDDEFYNATRRDLLNFLKQLDNEFVSIGLVGHNPGLTELAHFLLYDFNYELPTCALVYIELDINNWTELKSGVGTLKFFEYPKKYK